LSVIGSLIAPGNVISFGQNFQIDRFAYLREFRDLTELSHFRDFLNFGSYVFAFDAEFFIGQRLLMIFKRNNSK
jgi:hypothetical protein